MNKRQKKKGRCNYRNEKMAKRVAREFFHRILKRANKLKKNVKSSEYYYKFMLISHDDMQLF